MAAGDIGLRTWRGVAALLIHRGIGGSGLLAARRRCNTALALPVVQRADHDRLIDIVVGELDQHLLADPRQPLPAHAGTGLALRHADPARAAVILALALLPREANPNLPARADVVFGIAARLRLALRSDHGRGLHAERSGGGEQSCAIAIDHARAPRTARIAGAEQIGVAVLLGRLAQRRGWHAALHRIAKRQEAHRHRPILRRAGRRIEAQRGLERAQPLAQRGARLRREVVQAAVLDDIEQQRIGGLGIFLFGQMRTIGDRHTGAADEGAHGPLPGEQLRACLDALHQLLGQPLRAGGIADHRLTDR